MLFSPRFVCPISAGGSLECAASICERKRSSWSFVCVICSFMICSGLQSAGVPVLVWYEVAPEGSRNFRVSYWSNGQYYEN